MVHARCFPSPGSPSRWEWCVSSVRREGPLQGGVSGSFHSFPKSTYLGSIYPVRNRQRTSSAVTVSVPYPVKETFPGEVYLDLPFYGVFICNMVHFLGSVFSCVVSYYGKCTLRSFHSCDHCLLSYYHRSPGTPLPPPTVVSPESLLSSQEFNVCWHV